MAIKVICPNPACGKPLKVADHFGGKMGQCPECLTRFLIPLPEGATRPPPPQPVAPAQPVMPTVASLMVPPPVRHRPPAAPPPAPAPVPEWYGEEAPARPSEQATPRPAAAEINTPRPRPSPHAIQPTPHPPTPPAGPRPTPMFEVVDEPPAYQPPPPQAPPTQPPAPRYGVVNSTAGYEVVDDEDDATPYAVQGQQPTPTWGSETFPERSERAYADAGRYDDEEDVRDLPGRGSNRPSDWYTPKRKRIGTRSAWSVVKVGITLVAIAVGLSVLIFVMAVGVVLTGSIALVSSGSREPAAAAPPRGVRAMPGRPPVLVASDTPSRPSAWAGFAGLLIIGIGVCAVGQGLCTLVGFGLCVAAPSRYGAKGLAIATLGCLLGEVAFGCAGFFTFGIGFIIALLLGLISYALFLAFIRAVGLCMQDRGLGDSAMDLLKLMIGLIVAQFAIGGGFVGLAAVTDMPPLAAQIISGTIGVIFMILWLCNWVKYAQLLMDARRVIDQRIAY
jgi:hypothetical protein